MFFTASRADGVVHGWDTKDTYEEHTSHSIVKIENENQQINALCSLQNSQYLGVAGSSGMDIVEFRKENGAITDHKVVQSLSQDQGDILTCLDTMLPISHQHVLTYTSQRGSMFMYDLRCRREALV